LESAQRRHAQAYGNRLLGQGLTMFFVIRAIEPTCAGNRSRIPAGKVKSVRPAGGTALASCFTPFTFNANTAAEYSITFPNYNHFVFNH
jgi:hypothetical protein